jgi:hypothetical protein|eukprot:COSAG01_NODE_935_length_12642_cov_37.069361_16_plen_92_part_00
MLRTGKHALCSTQKQLWRIQTRGAGANIFWTDGTDAGGHFRASISKLCEDLCRPTEECVHSSYRPLLIACPNFAFGERTEEFVPNPACTDA